MSIYLHPGCMIPLRDEQDRVIQGANCTGNSNDGIAHDLSGSGVAERGCVHYDAKQDNFGLRATPKSLDYRNLPLSPGSATYICNGIPSQGNLG